MARTKISEFSATPASNTDIDSIFIGEGMAPSNVNDAIRELMAQLKDFQVGSAGDPVTVGGVLTVQAGSASTPSLTTAGDTNTGMFFPAADTIAFAEGGAEIARFDSSGNLGVGITPTERLHIFKSTYPIFKIESTSYNSTMGIDTGTGNLVITNASNAAMQFATNNTERMRLDASGNFMVGGTTALGKVTVTSSGSEPTLVLKNNSGANASYSELLFTPFTGTTAASANIRNIYSQNNASILTFGTTNSSSAPTERARIDESGNFSVGSTSNTDGRIKADATTGTSIVTAVWAKNSAGSSAGTYVAWNAATTGNNLLMDFYTEASPSLRGSISFNRGAGVIAYNVTSDYRSKDINGPVVNSGALIDSVPVYMGKMKGATQERPMFIAHETPSYAHTGEKDAVDADGNPVYQQMDASALIPVMWAEIQSLRKRLADAGIA